MSKEYNFDLAKRMIQMKSDVIESASLGMEEDWFWTAETVYEDDQFQKELIQNQTEIGGISGSNWATPSLYLKYKDGREEFIDCFTGSSESERPSWMQDDCLSAPCQDWVESVKTPKLENI